MPQFVHHERSVVCTNIYSSICWGHTWDAVVLDRRYFDDFKHRSHFLLILRETVKRLYTYVDTYTLLLFDRFEIRWYERYFKKLKFGIYNIYVKMHKNTQTSKKDRIFLGFLLTSNLFEKRWTPISKFDDSTYVDTYTLFDRFEIRYEIFQKFEIRNLHIRENAQKLKNTQISKKNSYIRTTTTHWTGRLRFQVSILFNTSKEKKEKLISNLKMMQTEDTMEMDTDCKQGEDEQVRVRSFFSSSSTFFFFTCHTKAPHT